MSNQKVVIDVNAIVSRMNKFASNTKSDYVSVGVARVAQRLEQAGNRYQPALTEKELRIIKMFHTQRQAA